MKLLPFFKSYLFIMALAPILIMAAPNASVVSFRGGEGGHRAEEFRQPYRGGGEMRPPGEMYRPPEMNRGVEGAAYNRGAATGAVEGAAVGGAAASGGAYNPQPTQQIIQPVYIPPSPSK